MIQLIRVGFFREMHLGTGADESYETARGNRGHSAKERILSYLQGGHVVPEKAVGDAAHRVDRMLFVYTNDEAETEADATVPLNQPQYMTDGRFAWSSELTHYVRAYNVHLPDSFLDHMATFSYCVPGHVNLALVTLSERKPSLADWFEQLRDAWPAILAEVDVVQIQQQVADLKREVRELVAALQPLIQVASGDSAGAKSGDVGARWPSGAGGFAYVGTALHLLSVWLRDQAVDTGPDGRVESDLADLSHA